MQGSSDLLFLAIITGFILYKLYNLLGKTSDDPKWNGDISEVNSMNESSNADMKQVEAIISKNNIDDEVKHENNEVQEVLENIKHRNAAFSSRKFSDGAQAAFEIILKAYSESDISTLESLLNPEVLKIFQDDIKIRQNDNLILNKTLVAIVSSEIVEAKLTGNMANISVKFVTQQVNLIKNKEGEIIEGDPGQIDTAIDIWTFVKDVTSKDPVWKLDQIRSET